MPKNKVKYGLKSAYYAVATFDDNGGVTYGTPVALPGSVSLSLDPQGDSNVFRADNIDYFTSMSNNGYEGDYEIAMIPDDFRKDILGEVVDQNGLLVETVQPASTHFAFLFEVDGDQNAARHVLYNCTASRPSVGGETTGDTVEPQTDTITISAHPMTSAALNREIVKARVEPENATPYGAWFTEVQLPSAQQTGG
ncbi:MAG TPA: phage tail protein [Lachnospiraceae bacterium]|nr:phage tail protein [Lachnospiraceae bacterium]